MRGTTVAAATRTGRPYCFQRRAVRTTLTVIAFVRKLNFQMELGILFSYKLQHFLDYKPLLILTPL